MSIRRTLVATIVVCCASIVSAQSTLDQDNVRVVGDFGTLRFRVEIADDAKERSQGLMHRKALAKYAGMLFVFERSQTATFWMKNTLIPLDLIFADQTGLIKHIHYFAEPLDETPIEGGDNIYAVLEINGGLSQAYGIKTGDILQHPVFVNP